MPIYEYVCEEPGKEPEVIELLRSAADADKPVPDPDGKGRVFKRRLSVFASGGQGGPEGLAVGPGLQLRVSARVRLGLALELLGILARPDFRVSGRGTACCGASVGAQLTLGVAVVLPGRRR